MRSLEVIIRHFVHITHMWRWGSLSQSVVCLTWFVLWLKLLSPIFYRLGIKYSFKTNKISWKKKKLYSFTKTEPVSFQNRNIGHTHYIKSTMSLFFYFKFVWKLGKHYDLWKIIINWRGSRLKKNAVIKLKRFGLTSQWYHNRFDLCKTWHVR